MRILRESTWLGKDKETFRLVEEDDRYILYASYFEGCPWQNFVDNEELWLVENVYTALCDVRRNAGIPEQTALHALAEAADD